MHITRLQHQQMRGAGNGAQIPLVRVGGLHVHHCVEEASSEADPQFGSGVQVFQRGLGVQEEDRVFLAGLGEWDVAGRQVAVGHFLETPMSMETQDRRQAIRVAAVRGLTNR